MVPLPKVVHWGALGEELVVVVVPDLLCILFTPGFGFPTNSHWPGNRGWASLLGLFQLPCLDKLLLGAINLLTEGLCVLLGIQAMEMFQPCEPVWLTRQLGRYGVGVLHRLVAPGATVVRQVFLRMAAIKSETALSLSSTFAERISCSFAEHIPRIAICFTPSRRMVCVLVAALKSLHTIEWLEFLLELRVCLTIASAEPSQRVHWIEGFLKCKG
mmetsp:Transcript_67633/g.119983  ORF Transcript_67633/g.119983 Transcript_67633/m.119983 type:complete len:215 (+) Transcript_67633:1514-2158(+)